MAEPLSCPCCSALLTDSQVSTLYGRMTNSRRKTKSGGKNGGRRKGQVIAGTLAVCNGAVPICLDRWEDAEGAQGGDVKELVYAPLETL